MPFDGIGSRFIEVPTITPFCFETATPDARLLELARWLEDEQAWRDSRMVWMYELVSMSLSGPCGTAGCAMGLASKLWPSFGKISNDDLSVAERLAMSAFSLSMREVCWLFEGDAYPNTPLSEVTPGMVATAIREFVAARSAS